MTTRGRILAAGVALSFVAGVAQAEVFVYPKSGQNQEQFQRDQFECHNWAQGQTGVNPMQSAPVAAAPPPATGGAVRGGARGAAVGAIGGAIGGDAGKGAAIGAGVGAATGLIRQNRYNREVAYANEQAQAAQSSNLQRYDQAYAACMSGRGYQVR